MKNSELLIRARTQFTSRSNNHLTGSCVCISGTDTLESRAKIYRGLFSAAKHITRKDDYLHYDDFSDRSDVLFLFDKAIALAQIQGD
jgi:hypothetical protein